MSTFVLPLSDPGATLEIVGGKGMSLAKMAQAGLPVPGGFHVTTEAYRCFVTENGIQPRILEALKSVQATPSPDPALLETISQQISQYFMAGTIPPDLAAAITTAYASLPGQDGASAGTAAEAAVPAAVAVRSSATAEDLPGASFAGQQETYLNIRGGPAVLEAVKKCWASLWTARAIAYRTRQGIAPESVALAVVVQKLVFADAAGVLFTANPVNGNRDEMMITATWGLGEAIVGGLVTPDTLVVEKAAGKVLHRETSEKQVMTIRTETGTAEHLVPQHLKKAPVLSDAQAAGLARLGGEIERLYGMPMDIEWTLKDGTFAIVQARPVTTLQEAPLHDAPLTEPPLVWARSNPKVVLGRSSFAEFVPDPVSPLFATLAMPIAQRANQKLATDFVGLDDPDTYVFEVVNGYVYLGFVMTAKTVWQILSQVTWNMKRMMREGRERWPVIRASLRNVAEKWKREVTTLPAPELLAGARELFQVTAEYYTVAQTSAIPMAPMNELIFNRFYNPLVKRKSDPEASAFFLGFDTIPLRAEKSLYDLATWAKGEPELADYLLRAPTQEICAALFSDPVPDPLTGQFVQRFAAHLTEFGHTIYDLDFSKPVPADDPAPLLDAIKTYLAGKGGNPHERQCAQVERREQAAQAIIQRLDPMRRKWFTKLLKNAQDSAPVREDCIADLGLAYPSLRALLGELGRRLAAGGAIAGAQDVYWLEAQEVDQLAAALEKGVALGSYHELVELRKAFWRRVRGITPPTTLPEKSWMSRLIAHDNPEGSVLKGYAASAGKVTARACLLRGPDDFDKMQPGDIIVTVTTTPAWTPLFALASAVVTDIGGPLSHSSIVAREYGIPAVMATGVASKRIRHGQIITVDGTAGTVTLQE